ncbi:MAG: hypothetical protein ACOCY7_00830 [Halodesulfurarchaeum sp.]
MTLTDRIAEFMKAYSIIIVMNLAYFGVIEFSDRSHTFLETVIWVILAVIGIYGILTFIIVEGLDF